MGNPILDDPKVFTAHTFGGINPALTCEEAREAKKLFEIIRAKELPDGWFCYNDIEAYRDMIECLPDGATIAEVGSWKGRSLCSIADLIIKKSIVVFVIDTFEGSENDPDQANAAKTVNINQEFKENIAKYGITSNVKIIRNTSWIGSKLVFSALDMVFIDANHSYENVKGDLACWFPKVKPGGYIAGHDYHFPEVKKAVDEAFPPKENADNADILQLTGETARFIWSVHKPKQEA